MGYVPPPPIGIITLPANTTYTSMERFREQWYANAAYPRMVIVPPSLPRTFDEYRRSLYGAPSTDWLPFLSAAFLVGAVALIVVVALWMLS
jgi:hypothetical protein